MIAWGYLWRRDLGRVTTLIASGLLSAVAVAAAPQDTAAPRTVQAVRLSAELQIDGQLDEPVYRDIPAISDFVQQMPVEGDSATEKTQAWVHPFSTIRSMRFQSRPFHTRPSSWTVSEMIANAASTSLPVSTPSGGSGSLPPEIGFFANGAEKVRFGV